MKKLITIFAIAVALCSVASAETFVVSRNGEEVSATRDGKTWVADSNIDRKDPTVFLAAFFKSYFSQGKEWKGWVADFGFFDSKEELIAVYEESYEEFYGLADSISVTIDPAKFKANGNGSALYTVRFAYSYEGESDEGEDEVSLVKDTSGGWLVVKLPR